MHNRVFTFAAKLLVFFILLFPACKTREYESPPGYDFATPVTMKLDHGLKEISGICFREGDEQMLSAVEDENGKIYDIRLPGSVITSYRFGDKGDYEDLACWKNKIFVLKSNGNLSFFSIPTNGTTVSTVDINDSILPKAEYEGMAIHKDTLYVLCKVCDGIASAESLRIYRIAIRDNGSLTAAGIIEPKIIINKEGKAKNEKIHPSCLAKNPVDGNWYIISSANKLMMIFDDHFNLKTYYRLNPALFGQPEGLAFKSNGDMLISNEGGDGSSNIRQFIFKTK